MPARFSPTRQHWFCDFWWKSANGTKKRYRVFPPINTKRGADEYERKVKNEIAAGTYMVASVECPTFKAFVGEFMQNYAKPNNKASEYASKESRLKNHLTPYFGSTRLDQIDKKLIDAFKAELQAKNKNNKTTNNLLTFLSTILNVAVEWGVLKYAPKIKRLKVKERELDFYSIKELSAILKATTRPEIKTAILLAVNTGLRLGELCGLRWNDLDLTTARMVVRNSIWHSIEGTPKGDKAAEVPLNEVAVKALAEHRGKGVNSIYVFSDTKGQPHTGQYFHRHIRKACIAAKVPANRCCHKLRHTFGSFLAQANTPLKTVQQLLRHTDIKTTMRYAHVSPAYRVTAVDALVQSFGQLEGNNTLQIPESATKTT